LLALATTTAERFLNEAVVRIITRSGFDHVLSTTILAQCQIKQEKISRYLQSLICILLSMQHCLMMNKRNQSFDDQTVYPMRRPGRNVLMANRVDESITCNLCP
jgi:hypothetical protein